MSTAFVVQMKLALRLPRNPIDDGLRRSFYVPMEFMDDTGSDYMVLHQRDLEFLRQTTADQYPLDIVDLPPIMGVTTVWLGNGHKERLYLRGVMVNLLHPTTNQPMSNWEWVQCAIREDNDDGYIPCPRLNGPCVRQKLFIASAPGKSSLCGSNQGSGFASHSATRFYNQLEREQLLYHSLKQAQSRLEDEREYRDYMDWLKREDPSM